MTSNSRAGRNGARRNQLPLVALGVSVALTETAAAAGGGGRIAWTRNSLSTPKASIVSANPNGKHRLKLTHPDEAELRHRRADLA